MWCRPGLGTLTQPGAAWKAGGGGGAESEGRARKAGSEEASPRKGRATPEGRPAGCVWGPHCLLARFVFIFYCCYKNNRGVLLQFWGPEVRIESSGAKTKVLAGLLSSGNCKGEGPSSPLPASGSSGFPFTPMSTSVVRSLLFCSLTSLPPHKDSCHYT